jgi:bifunctional non-homologous end joining protein LigD
MAPTLVRHPFHRPGWVYEGTVDGWRIVAYRDGACVRLLSRHGVDHARRFPEVAAAVAKLTARSLVLDSELRVFDELLRSRFDLLRHPDSGIVTTPPLLMAFDLMHLDGRDLSGRPLRERRARLEDLLPAARCRFPCGGWAPRWPGHAWRQVVERGYEGYVAKDEASLYVGGRTRT